MSKCDNHTTSVIKSILIIAGTPSMSRTQLHIVVVNNNSLRTLLYVYVPIKHFSYCVVWFFPKGE